MARKKDGEQRELSKEEIEQQQIEKAFAREGYDVRDNLIFIREYGADDFYLGKIFTKAVIEAKDCRMSLYSSGMEPKARDKKTTEFQKRVRQFLSGVKVKLRFAEAKNTTVEAVLGEFDEINYAAELGRMTSGREGMIRGIENTLYDLLGCDVPFDRISAAVLEGAKEYRHKKGPGEYFYLESRHIQESLERCLEESRGGKSG